MKKIIKTMFAAMAVTLLFITSSGTRSFALMEEKTHCCVTVQDTPMHKETTCVGAGTACETVAVC